MAHLHTSLPSGEGLGGERIHADAHVVLGGDETHLWFGVNYLAGVTDIDAIVAVESLGVFVIEVKGVPSPRSSRTAKALARSGIARVIRHLSSKP